MFNEYKNICGIYKLTFPNEKIYIGLSSNIQKRLIAHKNSVDNLPIHRAIRKYGLEANYISILEQFSIVNRVQLQEREKYWIKYFDSINKGYNLTPGGDGAAEGIFNVSAKLTKDTLNKLIQDLIDNKIYIKDLALKYSLSKEAISDINQGKRYYNDELNYPLRPDTRFTSEQMSGIKGVDKGSSKFSEKELAEIIQDLINNAKSLETIAKEHNCSTCTISHINTGKHYPNKNLSYPIRKMKKTTTKINENDFNEIIKLLKETNLSYEKIGNQFNLSASAIGRINRGQTHRNDKYEYPIRNK